MADVIELDDVCKAHRMGTREVNALAGVSMRVARGDYVAVTGASGSGKTTLLHLIGCLDRPTRGTIRIDGTDVATLDDDALSELRSRRIGFVFQAFHLIPQLDVCENVELPLIYQGVDRTERAERARRMLASVGLSARSRHRPTELSGGECQRVAIARALVVEPAVLLADEPTGNLDSRTGDEIMGLLEGLHDDGVSIVLVTHDPDKARRASRCIEMRDGRIAQQLGTPTLARRDPVRAAREPGPPGRGEALAALARALVTPDGRGRAVLLEVPDPRQAQVLMRQVGKVSAAGRHALLVGADDASAGALAARVLHQLGAPPVEDPRAWLGAYTAHLHSAGLDLALAVDDAAALPLETAAWLGSLVRGSGGALRVVLARTEDPRLPLVVDALVLETLPVAAEALERAPAEHSAPRNPPRARS